MIDLEQEEFLSRLDARLITISSMLAYHEKIMINTYLDRKKALEAEKVIDKIQREFLNYIQINDKQICDRFEQLKKEIGK